MIRSSFIIVSLLLLSVGKPVFAADGFYSFKDKNGVLHFSNFYSDSRLRPMGSQSEGKENLSPENIERIIHRTSRRHDVDPKLVKAVIKVESDFNPRALSRAGAQGLMQLMPATSRDLNISDPYNPHESIEGGVKYLRSLLDYFKNDVKLALAAYNAGKTTVLRYKGIPPYKETKNYVKKVLDYYNQYRRL